MRSWHEIKEKKMKKLIFVLYSVLLTSCQSLPQIFQATEEIATDEAIGISVSRETFQKETDLNISVEVKNKDQGS